MYLTFFIIHKNIYLPPALFYLKNASNAVLVSMVISTIYNKKNAQTLDNH